MKVLLTGKKCYIVILKALVADGLTPPLLLGDKTMILIPLLEDQMPLKC